MKENNLEVIPGVGKSIAEDLRNIGVHCLLYVFREAVYFAENPNPDPEKLKWWYWKDK